MQTKEQFIDEVLKNNLTIAQTCRLAKDHPNEEINNIRTIDFLKFPYTYSIELPDSEYFSYLKEEVNEIKSRHSICYITEYYSYDDENDYSKLNEIVTFKNFVSYYLSQNQNLNVSKSVCPDCKGTKEIVLLISKVACTTCK